MNSCEYVTKLRLSFCIKTEKILAKRLLASRDRLLVDKGSFNFCIVRKTRTNTLSVVYFTDARKLEVPVCSDR
jgi:hypothetical protein